MPPMMNSNVSYAKHTLPYPIYSAEFDPYNRGYLLVAGGGGESKTGIPNQITLLDVNNRAIIETAAEIDLSREEDSPQSIASLATKDGLITYAGINSAQNKQDQGTNEHFRAIEITYPPRKRQKTDSTSGDEKASINQLGKGSLFKAAKGPRQEKYQRLTRLSPASSRSNGRPSRRIGAIASSLGKQNEVVVFDATVTIPQPADILTQIELPEKQEAADLDITNTDEDEFSLAYCDDYDVYEQTFKYDFDKKKVEKRPNGPRRVHQMPHGDNFQKAGSRSKFRCLRFLNSQNLVTVVNKAGKTGAELRIFHLYPTGPALHMGEKQLPSRIKQANSLDVCALDADKNGNQQFVIAVAGSDNSIEVYTVDYQAATDTFSSIRSFLTLRDVHKQVITKVVWAPFHSPARAHDQPTTGSNGQPIKREHPGPQYVRLASTSIGNTVVIDTFPLQPLEPKKGDSRYVLSHPNDRYFWTGAYILIISVVVLVTAFLMTAFSSGFAENNSGPFSLLPQGVKDFLDMPAGAAYNRAGYSKVTPDVPVATVQNLRLAIAEHHASPEDAQATAVVIRDVPEGDGVEVHVHPEKEKYLEKDTNAKHWHELEEHEKAFWKEKLTKAGQWVESEGESVLKGVLWSTYAGLVGQAGQAVLREL